MDRLFAISDILMGAAYADGKLHGREEAVIRQVLGELLGQGGILPAELDARIRGFKKEALDVDKSAAIFHDDDVAVKRKLLEVIASIGEADEENDLDEDAYLKRVGAALKMPADSYADLALQVEVGELRDVLLPPPPKV